MLKQHEIDKIREDDQKKLGTVTAKTEDIARARMTAIQEKSQNLKDKIQELIDEKHKLFRAPYTKAETLELAKEALRENRKKWFFDNFLVAHLRGCQIQRAAFLSPAEFQVYSFPPQNAWKMAYQIITEEDLEKAAELLPDIGLPVAERDAQIKKLDKEIAALEGQIEKALKEA